MVTMVINVILAVFRGVIKKTVEIMAVYVDDMYKISLGQLGRMKMSHLMADTTKELLDMCDKIGVNKKWIQKEGTKWEHFDIAISKRKLAIENGAVEIGMRELAKMAQEREGSQAPLKL